MSDAMPEGLTSESQQIGDMLKDLASFQKQSLAVMTQTQKLVNTALKLEKERTKREKENRDKDKKAQKAFWDGFQGETEKTAAKGAKATLDRISPMLASLEKYVKSISMEDVQRMKPDEYKKAMDQIIQIEKQKLGVLQKEKSKEVGSGLLWAATEKSPLLKFLTTGVAGLSESKPIRDLKASDNKLVRGLGKGISSLGDGAYSGLSYSSRYKQRVKTAESPFLERRENVENQAKFSAGFNEEEAPKLSSALSSLKSESGLRQSTLDTLRMKSLFPDIFPDFATVKEAPDQTTKKQAPKEKSSKTAPTQQEAAKEAPISTPKSEAQEFTSTKKPYYDVRNDLGQLAKKKTEEESSSRYPKQAPKKKSTKTAPKKKSSKQAPISTPKSEAQEFTSTKKPYYDVRNDLGQFAKKKTEEEEGSSRYPKQAPLKPTEADVAKLPYNEAVGFMYLGNVFKSLFSKKGSEGPSPEGFDLPDIDMSDMATAASALKKLGPALAKAGPAIAGLAGLAMIGKDVFDALGLSEEWGVDKLSAGIGGALGGTKSGVEGAFFNGIKGALIGFSIGGPPGALVGLAFGAAAGAIGGETIAKEAKKIQDEAAAVAAQGKEEGFLSGAKAFFFGSDASKKKNEEIVNENRELQPLMDILYPKYKSKGFMGLKYFGRTFKQGMEEFFNDSVKGKADEAEWKKITRDYFEKNVKGTAGEATFPKFHQGGRVPYGASYETPAILRGGEKVLTPGMADIYDQDIQEVMKLSEKLERLDLTNLEQIMSQILNTIQTTLVNTVAEGNTAISSLRDVMKPSGRQPPQMTPVVLGAV